MFMEMARIASKRATCHRLNVGALVVQDNNPVSVGWNGQLPGAAHCKGNECPGIIPGKCGTLHAETNALQKASNILINSGTRYGVDLYCTHSPCKECATFIRETTPLTVNRIFFEVPYRDTSHLGMFAFPDDENHIGVTGVYELTPAGYIIEYFSRKVVELP